MPAVLVVLLAAFLAAWGGGGLVPLLPGDNLYEQQRTIAWAYLVLAVPWAICRMGRPRNAWPVLSLVAGAAPGRLILARFAAVAGYLALVLALAAPLMMLAQQMSAVAPARPWVDGLVMFLFSLAAAAVTLHIVAWSRNPLAAWLLSAATAAALRVSIVPAAGTEGLPLAAAAIAVVAAATLSRRADRTLTWLKERRA